MGKNFVIGCNYVLFLFFTQNQVPQIIIGLGRRIKHIKALLVGTQTKLLKKLELFFLGIESDQFEAFEFWSNFEQLK